jgi:hypothetical protein
MRAPRNTLITLALAAASLGLAGTAGAATTHPAATAAASCGSGNWSGVVVTSWTPHDHYFCNPGYIETVNDKYTSDEQIATKVAYRFWTHQNDTDGGSWSDCFQSNNPTTWNLTGRDAQAGSVQMSSNTAPC